MSGRSGLEITLFMVSGIVRRLGMSEYQPHHLTWLCDKLAQQRSTQTLVTGS